MFSHSLIVCQTMNSHINTAQVFLLNDVHQLALHTQTQLTKQSLSNDISSCSGIHLSFLGNPGDSPENPGIPRCTAHRPRVSEVCYDCHDHKTHITSGLPCTLTDTYRLFHPHQLQNVSRLYFTFSELSLVGSAHDLQY